MKKRIARKCYCLIVVNSLMAHPLLPLLYCSIQITADCREEEVGVSYVYLQRPTIAAYHSNQTCNILHNNESLLWTPLHPLGSFNMVIPNIVRPLTRALPGTTQGCSDPISMKMPPRKTLQLSTLSPPQSTFSGYDLHLHIHPPRPTSSQLM